MYPGKEIPTFFVSLFEIFQQYLAHLKTLSKKNEGEFLHSIARRREGKSVRRRSLEAVCHRYASALPVALFISVQTFFLVLNFREKLRGGGAVKL